MSPLITPFPMGIMKWSQSRCVRSCSITLRRIFWTGTSFCGNIPMRRTAMTYGQPVLRYLGMDGYPQLVTDEEFLAVRLRRGEQNTYAPCPSEIIPIRDKAVCALCGEKMARDTKSHGRPRWRCKNPECGGSVYLDDSIILERVVQKLKVLAHSPACIQLPKAAPASTDALRIENELALCFNRADINPEYMKTLIMAAAAERYAGLNDPTPAHRLALLRQKLELEPENEETLWELFESAVTHVCIGKGGEISLSQKDQKECAS